MLWKRKPSRAYAALAGGALSLLAAAPAAAQTPNCADLDLPHPVYGAGGSAITADLQKVATALSGLPQPITILFSDPSACTGFKQFIDKKVTGDFKYWGSDGVTKTCKPPAAGLEVQFAHMGNPGSDCAGQVIPAEVKDFAAPVQTLNVIVGPNNDDDAITAEALYFIYGKGPAVGNVAPWVNPADVARRTPTSFVHLFLAAAIGVPPASFKGDVVLTTNPDTVKHVKDKSAINKNTAIGYVSGSAADAARSDVKTLAFQAKDQTCAYYPDSSANSKDKANVINGQYALWTAGHWYTRVNGSGDIVSEDVKNLIDWYNGTAKAPGDVDVLGLAIDAGDIPLCAMKVTREGLLGAVSSWAPPIPCTHFFEKRANGSTTGTECTSDDACKDVQGSPKCHFGYCEAY